MQLTRTNSNNNNDNNNNNKLLIKQLSNYLYSLLLLSNINDLTVVIRVSYTRIRNVKY